MQIENELRLSYYRELADVKKKHAVKLVQHTESGRFFVLKKLSIYDIHVFRYLADHPLPGIPHIEELIEDENTLYVIEEYIPGVTLADRLEEQGPFPEAEALDLIRRVCQILLPLHALTPPIVHRDIKPSNLILTPEGGLFLVDFNSAKESSSLQTKDTVLFGTVGYAAPEQYGFAASKPTADIYAVGVLFNVLLTGKLPTERPAEGHCAPLIRRCLQMDPANRYRDAAELLHALGPAPKAKAFRAAGKTARSTGASAGPAGASAWNTGSARGTQTASQEAGRSDFRRLLPPGLGSRRIWVVVLSALWYLTISWLCLTLQVENISAAGLIIERIVMFLDFFCWTLWIGNYRGIWARMPLTKDRRILVKVIGVLLWGFLLLFGIVVILIIFLSAFHLA